MKAQVHTPWCVKCEAMSKQVLKLAKHFKGFESLVFARFDASVNEHAKLQVNHILPATTQDSQIAYLVDMLMTG